MRILFVDLEREWRGGQSQALLTLQGLRRRGHDAELLAPRNSPLAKRCAAANIPVHAGSRWSLRIGASRLARELMLHGNYALLHLNEPHALTTAWLAGAPKKLPLLLSRRIGFPLRHGWASRSRYAAVTRFVANSNQVAQSLVDSGIAAFRISVVNEGVDIQPPPSESEKKKARAVWGVQDRDFLFGCAGVFVSEKGQRHLIEALPAVRRVHPEARLLLAGDGPCRTGLQTLAQQLGQTDAVIFPGFVNNMDEFYAALDVFAFPSEFEGLGTALQVAMAAALPCISTRRGALEEVVDHERTVLVVEPNAEEFAGAMLRLLDDHALRVRIGQSARQEVEQRFSADRMVENTLRVYQDVIQKWPTP
jgi:glycosyltransferase involved in cell wall biosynthesis